MDMDLDSVEDTPCGVAQVAVQSHVGIRSEIVVTRKVRFWVNLLERMELLGSRRTKAIITKKEAFVFISRIEFQRSPANKIVTT